MILAQLRSPPKRPCPLCRGAGAVAPDTYARDAGAGGVLRAGGSVVRFTPLEANIFEALVDAWPRALATRSLITAAYGHAREPEDAAGCVQVTLCKMRTKLAAIGVDITRYDRCGYVLAAVQDDTPDAREAGL